MAAEAQGLKYRCPECGTLNEDSALTFPNCVQCRENLFKCSYCTRFKGPGQVCAFFPRQPLTPNDVVPDCSERQSRLLTGLRPLLLRPLGTGPTPFILTMTVLGLIVAAASVFGPESTRLGLRGLEVEPYLVEKPVHVGGTVVVRFNIDNHDTEHPANFQVRLTQHKLCPKDDPQRCNGLPYYRFISMDPPQLDERPIGNGRYFQFKPLGPGESMSLQLKCEALQAGTHPIFADVLTVGDHTESPPRAFVFRVTVDAAPPVIDREASAAPRPPVARDADEPVS